MLRRLILALALCVSVAQAAAAQQAPSAPPPRALQLRGIGAAEADALIRTLRELQSRLRRGDQLTFELLSGALASYPMTRVPPREAFLALSFDDLLSIERVATSNRLWQPHRFVFTPNPPGQLVWDVEVVIGINGNVERVEMTYRPPPPF